MIEDQRGVDWRPEVIRQRRICIALLERMELPIFEITQPRCEPLAEQGEQPEDVIAGTARIGEVFLDVEDRILIEQPIKHIGCLTFCRADRQDAGNSRTDWTDDLEFRTGFAAVVQIDVAALGGSVARAEELPI